MSSARPLELDLDRLQRRSLLVGLAALALALLGAVFNLPQFFRAYLLGYVFWWLIAVGCLALAMIYQMTRGAWGYVSRPFFEAGARTLPLLALLFLPLAFGLNHIYVWAADPDMFAGAPHTDNREQYLDPPFFLARAAFYFLSWVILALLVTASRPWGEEARKLAQSPGLGRLSGGGTVLLVFTVTFAAFDWLMSLDVHWYSTIFGALIAVGGLLMGTAFVVASLTWAIPRPVRPGFSSQQLLNDLGNLLLAFVMLWTYFSLSQFIIIWSGNLPEESSWYIRRSVHGWQWLAVLVAAFHFAVPFLLLLSREVKRTPTWLMSVAAGIMGMHYVYLFWTIVPEFDETRIGLHWLHLVLPVAIGGLWLAAYVSQLKRRLLPVLGELTEPAAAAGEVEEALDA